MRREVLLLGDERLYQKSTDVTVDELADLRPVVEDLHDTIIAFSKEYTFDIRAITAPQIGVFKRILYIYMDSPIVMVNPVVHFPDEEMIELYSSCMSFPGLFTKVKRHRICAVHYRNLTWQVRDVLLQNELACLMQHGEDHLNGILSTMRAIDDKSLYLADSLKGLEMRMKEP